jgi:hypothetical protein
VFRSTPPPPPRDELARLFVDPPAEYGPIDGWWWEAGRLDREKMRWQLEELKDKGIAGTWFYARYLYGEPLGSDPAYFSDGWWDYTRFVAEESERLGLIDWFSNWTALQFEQDALRAKTAEEPELVGHCLALYKKEGDGPLRIVVSPNDEIVDAAAYRTTADGIDLQSRVELTHADGSVEWTAPSEGWVLTAIASKQWDLDYVSPVVGERWTDVVLGEYERRLPDLIGNTVHAFGPDEMSMLKGKTLFSPALLARVGEMLGTDPRPVLIGLFTDIGAKTEQIRCTYYEAMSSLLDENFFAAPATWLHDRSMLHVSLSQNNNDLIASTWDHGDFIRYIKHFDVPGNEDPLWTPPGERRMWATKVSSSVAHLYDKQRSVVLGHYATGWGHTLEENLAWTNEEYAKGHNLYSRHLGSYSLMGGWYEYVPPHDHWYHPYWRYWKAFADQMRRLSYVMSQGKHRADVALIYPLTALFAYWRAEHAEAPAEGMSPSEIYFAADPDEDGEAAAEQTFEPAAFELSEISATLAKTIYDDGLDFDFVDDASMEHATVEDGVLKISGLEFRSVFMPPMRAIRRSTLEKIKEFYDGGGAVVAYGALPIATAEGGRDDAKLHAILAEMFDANPTRKAVRIADDVSKVPDAISGLIVRDVVASEKGIFQTHQKVGELDVYFAFSTHEEPRDVVLTLRVDGDVERWDPASGERHLLPSVRHGSTTTVEVHFETYEGVLLVVSPTSDAPPARAREVTRSVEVAGDFTFRIEPTMDNTWGDFRYPATKKLIGAEARRFRYRESDPGDEGWHEPSFDDGSWETVQYSHGPYWLEIGPYTEATEPEGLIEKAVRGDDGLDWRPYSFSKEVGSLRRHERSGFLGWFQHLIGVPQNFLVLDDEQPVQRPLWPLDLGGGETIERDQHHHYLFTTVIAPDDGDYIFSVGRRAGHPELSGLDQDALLDYHVPAGTKLWVNGDTALSVDQTADTAELSTKVQLRRGANDVLLRVVHPKGSDGSSYAAFLASEPVDDDPFVPRLLWFREPQQLVYDIHPDAEHRIGWYRFEAPPGVREMRLHADARLVEAWVDGERVDVNDGAIALSSPRANTSVVALRVEQHAGTYGGAVFTEPVEFICDAGRIRIGDWSEQGLPTYSGIGVYGTTIDLDDVASDERLVLDLGMVKTVAELFVNEKRAGVRFARPFRFDITELVHEGPNTIEIKVANTLANHYSTYPTRWVFQGQTVSGLLGPVTLQFLA